MAADTDIIILDGCTFFYSDKNGDVDAQAAEGFFFQDVRHLSRWHVRVDGKPVEPLTSRRVDYFSARIVATTPVTGRRRHPCPCAATASSPKAHTRTWFWRTSRTIRRR
jgi:hypothetical protein